MQSKNPDFVVINGKKYPVRTKVSNWVAILQIADDPTLTEAEKLALQLRIAYKKKIKIDDLKEAAEKLHWFICAGNERPRKSGSKRIVDFVQDWPYVVAAFQQQYGIDMTPAPWWKFWRRSMHWWHFIQLFNGLTDETLLVKIMGWRGMSLAKIKDKETRRHYQELKKYYALAPAGQAREREYSPQELLAIANKKLVELKEKKKLSAEARNGR